MKKKGRFKKFLKEHWLFTTIFILIVIWFVYSYFIQGVIYSLVNADIDAVINFVNSFGIFSELIFVVLVILEVVLAPMPPLVLYIAAGFLFGGFLGGILTLIGNLIGAFIDFKLARTLGRKTVEKSVSKKLKKKFENFFKKYGGFSIFILRVNPLTTSDIVSYLSGFTKMKTTKFLIATGLGLIPIIFIQTYFGDILIRNNPLLSAIVILFSLFYLLIFIYLIFKVLTRKKESLELS